MKVCQETKEIFASLDGHETAIVAVFGVVEEAKGKVGADGVPWTYLVVTSDVDRMKITAEGEHAQTQGELVLLQGEVERVSGQLVLRAPTVIVGEAARTRAAELEKAAATEAALDEERRLLGEDGWQMLKCLERSLAIFTKLRGRFTEAGIQPTAEDVRATANTLFIQQNRNGG